tara:strand:+ start:434 stop:1240 length:807 start_codon:yes stop_codon:yes gene_type:complete
MATLDLGKIKQVWRGTYNNSTAYTVDDLVEYTDSGITSTYICVANSTGNAPSSSGTAHASWNYVAKGVADPIPTQSGNAGKFLKTDGSSLSFDSAGGWVKTAGGTGPSSSVTEIALDNIFSADYKFYKVFIQWTQDDWAKIRFIDSNGNNLTSSNYTWVAVAVHENTDGGPDRVGYSNVTYIPGNFWNATDGSFCLLELTFMDPYSSNNQTGCSTQAHNAENAQLHSQHGCGFWHGSAQSIRGFKFSGDSGDTIQSGNFQYLVLGAKV